MIDEPLRSLNLGLVGRQTVRTIRAAPRSCLPFACAHAIEREWVRQGRGESCAHVSRAWRNRRRARSNLVFTVAWGRLRKPAVSGRRPEPTSRP